MTTLREAALMALDAMTSPRWLTKHTAAVNALRAALAKQIVPSDCSYSHQPDSWRTEARNELGLPVFFCASEVKQAGPGLIPLYTAPPSREWQSITDDEIRAIALTPKEAPGNYLISIVRAVENKLKERNA